MANYFNNAGLFSGNNSLFGTSSSSGNSLFSGSFLSDWNAIRSGSYGKLVKTYYAKQAAEAEETDDTTTKKTQELTSDTGRTLTATETSARNLKAAVDDLNTTWKADEVDTAYKAVKNFVSDYNSLLDKTAKSSNSGVNTNVDSMVTNTLYQEDALKEIGITIGEDNKLAVDEETFKKADMAKVEDLFKGNQSYGYQTSLRASLVNYHAGREADTYTQTGTYNSYTSGINFDDWF